MATNNDGDDANYPSHKVGYKHPPKEHQFKKGKSGYPRGRKPEPTDIDGYVDKHLKRKGSLKLGGKSITLSNDEIIAIQHVDKAKRGDRHAFDRICEQQRARVKPTMAVTAGDEAAVKAALERLKAETKLNETVDRPRVPLTGWSSELHNEPE